MAGMETKKGAGEKAGDLLRWKWAGKKISDGEVDRQPQRTRLFVVSIE